MACWNIGGSTGSNGQSRMASEEEMIVASGGNFIDSVRNSRIAGHWRSGCVFVF